MTAIPGRLVIVKEFDLPPDDPRSMEQAASLEAHHLSQMAGAGFLHGVLELPASEQARQGLLFMARDTDVADMIALVSRMDFDLIDVVPSPVALFRAIRVAHPAEAGTVVGIDVGARSTDVVIGVGAGIRLVRTFDLGVEAFIEALAQDRQISPAHAKELLDAQNLIGFSGGSDCRNQAIPRDSVELSDLRSGCVGLDGAIHAWVAEIEHTLALYRDRFPDAMSKPDRIWLAGGGACLAGLPEIVERCGGAPCSPLDCFGTGAGDHPERYAVAVGLAYEGLADRSLISLAPPFAHLNRRWRKERWFWAATLLLLLATIGLVVGRTMRATHYECKVKEYQRREMEATTVIRAELKAEHAANERVLNRLKVVYGVAGNRGAALRMIGALGDAKSDGDWITSFEAVPSPTNSFARPEKPIAASGTGLSQFAGFVVCGYTPDGSFHSVRAMIRRLQQDPRIKAVDLGDEPLQGKLLGMKPQDLQAVPFVLRMTPTEWGPDPFLDGLTRRDTSSPDGVQALQAAVQDEARWGREFGQEWNALRQTMATFKNSRDVFNLPAKENVALIDFRVALLETRSRLMAQARQRGMVLPPDFGLDDVARDDKSVRQSLYELATLRVLAGVALDGGVSGIESIESLPTVAHSDDHELFMEEYPLKVRFKCRFPVMLGLLEELGNSTHGMVVKALRVECRSLEESGMVEAEIVVAALVFPDASDMTIQARKEAFHDV